MRPLHEYPATLLKNQLPAIDYYEDVQAIIDINNNRRSASVAIKKARHEYKTAHHRLAEEFDVEQAEWEFHGNPCNCAQCVRDPAIAIYEEIMANYPLAGIVDLPDWIDVGQLNKLFVAGLLQVTCIDTLSAELYSVFEVRKLDEVQFVLASLLLRRLIRSAYNAMHGLDNMNSAMHRALSERIVAHALEEVFPRPPRAIETVSMYLADFSATLESNTPTYALEVEHVNTTHRSLEEAIDALNSHSTTIPKNVHTDALEFLHRCPYDPNLAEYEHMWKIETEGMAITHLRIQLS